MIFCFYQFLFPLTNSYAKFMSICVISLKNCCLKISINALFILIFDFCFTRMKFGGELQFLGFTMLDFVTQSKIFLIYTRGKLPITTIRRDHRFTGPNRNSGRKRGS